MNDPTQTTLAAAVLSCVCLGSAHAGTLFSDSFEAPDTTVSATGQVLAAPAGWDFVLDASNTVKSNGVFLATGVATGSDTSGDGVDDQVLRLFNSASITTTATQVGHLLSIGEEVTVTFDYGNLGAVSSVDRAGGATVELLAIDGSDNETQLASGSFSFTSTQLLSGLDGDFSLSHTVATNAGERLAVRITQNAGGSNHAVYDNLVLDVVPEPGSLALLGLGGVLVASRRRC